MAKTRVDLGKQAYLWKESQGYAPNVVISAHGFYRPNTPQYSPGAPTLWFYCAHGATVDNVPQSTSVRLTKATELVPNGLTTTVADYTLFKFGEHRASIEKVAKQRGWSFAEAEATLGSSGMGGETYATFRDVTDTQNDYVTVRNRAKLFGGCEIRLSELVAAILAEHTYPVIKCCFCREAKATDFHPNMRADLDD